jgi:outer membrane protein OmpA-like peptidoglycan-associated protein
MNRSKNSIFSHTRPHRLAVRTSLFQGGDTGSIPVGARFLYKGHGMKKLIILTCVVAAMSSSQEIALNGNRGMFSLQYARPHDMGMFSFHITPDWRYEGFDVTYQDTQITDRRHFVHLASGLSYSILDYLEMRFRAQSFVKYYETSDFPVHRDDPYPPWGFNCLEVGLKVGYPFIVDEKTHTYYAFGVDGYVDFSLELSENARTHDSSFYAGVFDGVAPEFPPYIPHNPDIGFTGLFDFRIGPFASHANAGYLITGTDRNPGYVTAADFNRLERPNFITHGFGIELIPTDPVRILFETYGVYNTEAKTESLWITPGLRFGAQTVSFDLGCELGVVNESDTRYWKPFFNISLGFDFVKKIEVYVPLAVISGKVYDVKTQDPIVATITFPGTDVEAAQTKTDGTYKISLTPGNYRVHVDAPDYRWKEQGIIVKDGAELVVDFYLNKVEIISGTVTGKVSDAETGKPVAATITFANSKTFIVTTDSTTGIYKATLPPATYSVKAEAEYYIMESAPLILAKDETKLQNFILKPVPKVGEKIVLKGIYFDFNSATIKPTSYPVLDDAAKVLKAKPKMRIEIGGHTDSVGSDSYNQKLSYQRAQSVRDYLVRYHAIDPSRLDVRGYGESQPIGDNRTMAGRDLNRRIEFRILSVE